jgi:S1-C subfamily serine protease
MQSEIRALKRTRGLLALLSVLLILVAGMYAWPMLRGWFGKPSGEPREIEPRGDLSDFEKTTINIYKKAKPSVVYVNTSAAHINPYSRRITEEQQGSGSGFVWDDTGTIVTNFHVVKDASSLSVVFGDATIHDATLVGYSAENDLAVLRIDVLPGMKLTPIPLGTSNDLQVGQAAFAIGGPFGLNGSYTMGIVSALNRQIKSIAGNLIDDVIQTDAAVNPGNSGGPLLDSAGRLIGVNTAIASQTGGNNGIGFAIPVDTVNRVVPQIIKTGTYQRARLGIQVDDAVAVQFKQANGGKELPGLPIAGIVAGGPADQAKLASITVTGRRIVIGDVITKINGGAIKTSADLFSALDKVKPGETVSVELWRDGATRVLSIKTK